MGGAIFSFSQKIGLKSTKNMRFCILHKPMGGLEPPAPPGYATVYITDQHEKVKLTYRSWQKVRKSALCQSSSIIANLVHISLMLYLLITLNVFERHLKTYIITKRSNVLTSLSSYSSARLFLMIALF